MSNYADRSSIERFLEFMTADIEGDEKVADKCAQEMADLNEVPSNFSETRRQLRQCRDAKELHRTYKT